MRHCFTQCLIFFFNQSKYIKVEILRISPFLLNVFYSISVFLLSLYAYTASEGRTKISPQNSPRQKVPHLDFVQIWDNFGKTE